MSGYFPYDDFQAAYYPQQYAAPPPPPPTHPGYQPPDISLLANRGGVVPGYQPPPRQPPPQSPGYQPPPRQPPPQRPMLLQEDLDFQANAPQPPRQDQYEYYDYYDYRDATGQPPYQQRGGPRPRGRGDFRGSSTRGGVARGVVAPGGYTPRPRGGYTARGGRGMTRGRGFVARARGGAPRGGTARGGGVIGPEKTESDEFTCSKRSPIKAFLSLYPNIEFTQTMLMHNDLGHAFGFQVEVDGKTFYGEGTTIKNAKSLAAISALTYVKAAGCENLVSPCNEYEEMKKVHEIKELQASRPKQQKRKDNRSGNPTFKRQKVTPAPVPCPGPPHTPTLVNFALLRQKYVGHHNEGDFTQTYSPPTTKGLRTCVLIVQGHVFKAEAISNQIARDKAASEAIVFFEKNPPAYVAAVKDRTVRREPVYDRADPEDYLNMLYCKAWKFLLELTKDLNPVYSHKQNLAFVLKIYGQKENLDDVDVVAFSSGAKIISPEYMSADGRAIHDCTSEALCIRAFRRYIVNQLMALGKGYKETVFRKNPFGRIMMKEGYKFVFVKNCSPMGDCKEFSSQFYNSMRNSNVFQHSIAEISASKFKNVQAPFDTTNCGKLHLYRKMALDHVPDQCLVPTPENYSYLRTLVSPSDKLALRNIVGVQGALLSTIIDNVYFPDLYIGRAFDEVAMKRAVYGRLQGVRLPHGVAVREPGIHRLTWKPSRMADKTTVYSFVWCEGCTLDIIRSDIGRVVDMIKPSDISDISEDMLKAYDSKEIKSAKPSQFCSYNYYVQFTELLTSLGKAKSVESLTKLKKSATVYQQSKEAIYKAFEQLNLGTWPKKTIFPNY